MKLWNQQHYTPLYLSLGTAAQRKSYQGLQCCNPTLSHTLLNLRITLSNHRTTVGVEKQAKNSNDTEAALELEVHVCMF